MRTFTGHVPIPKKITTNRGGTSYQFRYVDPTGVERAVNRPTKLLADQEAQRIRLELAEGRNPNLGRKPVGHYIEEYTKMIEDDSDADLARRRKAMLTNLRVHVLPEWGGMALRDITPKSIEHWVSKLAKSGLAAATVRSVYGSLSAFMTWAFREGYVSASPCQGKVPTMPPLNQRRTMTLTDADVARIYRETEPRYRMMVRLAALGCLRAGEVRGLRWLDIDPQSCRLTIRQQLLGGGEYSHPEFGPPKARTVLHTPEEVQLHPDVVANLVEHRAAFHVDNPWDLVFTTENGNPVSRDHLNRVWRLARQRAGCPKARFHDLRHYGVSKMLADPRVSITEAAAQARHRDGGVLMMKAYAHVLGDDRQRSAAALQGGGWD